MSGTGRPLDLSFYARDALVVARALIGVHLARRGEDGRLRVLRIVETEAYRGPGDAACHARVGLTRRTRTLLGPPGHAYVFLVYGMYDCFNVVCLAEGRGHAVLVRAGEPVSGIDDGARADGPGRLARAMGITRADDGADLAGERLFLTARDRRPPIAVTARIGVAYAGAVAEEPWRFYDATSAHVSRPSRKSVGLGGAAPSTASRPTAPPRPRAARETARRRRT